MSGERYALLSVSDKDGVAELAAGLLKHGLALLSTGGTATALRRAGLEVADVSTLTGFPEILDGRVKTLHPKLHGGLLARRDVAAHVEAMHAHDIPAIEVAIINLYPFVETLASGADDAACIENIDVGGPAMLRAAAKNHAHVTVVTDPADYDALLSELAAGKGRTSPEFRRRMAGKAFALSAAYDAAVANYFSAEGFESKRSVGGSLKLKLRYGENPHQRAALYVSDPRVPGPANARVLQGKALSYNNINDLDAAFALAADLGTATPACVIVKHAGPSGVARADTLYAAWHDAFRADPISAFGGVVAVNTILDGHTAQAMSEIFLEAIIAPEATPEAISALQSKPGVRLLLTGSMPDPRTTGVCVRSVAGGLLMQTRDAVTIGGDDVRIVTQQPPADSHIEAMLFAMTVCKHVKSNAIVLVHGRTTAGIGAGQMSRVDSAFMAVRKARQIYGDELPGDLVAASDAFFPFPDGLEILAEAGVKAIIQPGGSIRDAEVIAAADGFGIAMLMTGIRHFYH